MGVISAESTRDEYFIGFTPNSPPRALSGPQDWSCEQLTDPHPHQHPILAQIRPLDAHTVVLALFILIACVPISVPAHTYLSVPAYTHIRIYTRSPTHVHTRTYTPTRTRTRARSSINQKNNIIYYFFVITNVLFVFIFVFLITSHNIAIFAIWPIV